MSSNGYKAYYAEGSKLPKVSELLAVARYDDGYKSSVPRKGAASAAGWPNDNYALNLHAYWFGEVLFMDEGIFYARVVSLDGGDWGDWAISIGGDGSAPVAIGVL
jgi:hypothetical protein